MSSAESAAGGGLDPFAFLDLRDAIPAYVVIAVLFAADAALEDALTFVVVVCGALAVVFGGYKYLETGPRGAARRQARERFNAAPDATERKARRATGAMPLGVAIVIAVIAGDGLLDGRVLAVAVPLGYLSAR